MTPVTVVGSTTSLNVAVTVVAMATLVAPAAGVVESTVGGVVSVDPVVNDHTLFAASALPATSFTPVVAPRARRRIRRRRRERGRWASAWR